MKKNRTVNTINLITRPADAEPGSQLWLYILISACFFLANCHGKTEQERSGQSTKFQQYYVRGEKLYSQHCSNCHQKNGTGLGRLYPPLATSDFMNNHFNDVVCLIRHGKKGELIVNGKSFNQTMPGIPALTNLEITEIVNYIYNTWDNKRGPSDISEISDILEKCPADKL